MLISRANLAVMAVASKQSKLPGINRVQLNANGSTVAANEHMIIAVSPVRPEAAAAFPMVESGETVPPEGGIGMPLSLVKDALRNMPQADLTKQYARITRADEDAIGLMTTDGVRKDEVTAMPMRGNFPNWEKSLVDARCKARSGRIVVNGKLFVNLLATIMQACPDRGNFNPIWIEFGGRGDALYVRAHNRQTGQDAIGMVTEMDTGDFWIRMSDWEASILGKFGRTVKRVR